MFARKKIPPVPGLPRRPLRRPCLARRLSSCSSSTRLSSRLLCPAVSRTCCPQAPLGGGRARGARAARGSVPGEPRRGRARRRRRAAPRRRAPRRGPRAPHAVRRSHLPRWGAETEVAVASSSPTSRKFARYAAQRDLLQELAPDLLAATVDGFQGQERAVVLVSLVRAEPHPVSVRACALRQQDRLEYKEGVRSASSGTRGA